VLWRRFARLDRAGGAFLGGCKGATSVMKSSRKPLRARIFLGGPLLAGLAAALATSFVIGCHWFVHASLRPVAAARPTVTRRVDPAPAGQTALSAHAFARAAVEAVSRLVVAPDTLLIQGASFHAVKGDATLPSGEQVNGLCSVDNGAGVYAAVTVTTPGSPPAAAAVSFQTSGFGAAARAYAALAGQPVSAEDEALMAQAATQFCRAARARVVAVSSLSPSAYRK
jgi:hypothetical protein